MARVMSTFTYKGDSAAAGTDQKKSEPAYPLKLERSVLDKA